MVKICIYFLLLFAAVSCKSKRNADFFNIVLHNNNNGIPNKAANEYFEQGLAYTEEGKLGSAKKCFLKADRICPNMPVILNSIGNSYTEIKHPDSAVPYFEKALRVDSNFIITYVNFGCCLNNMGDLDRAKEILQLGLARHSTYRFDHRLLFLNLANTYYFKNDNRKAFEMLDSVKAGHTHDQLYGAAVELENRINAHSPYNERSYFYRAMKVK